MGQSVCKGKNCEDCTCCPITAEDIHRVLGQVYGVVTDCKKSFEERKKILCCLQDKYKCFINPFFPHYVQFKKDCYDYEYFILIATVKKFAIDVVLYWDLQDWVVLNSGTCYRHYYTGGCSKLEKSVAVRKPIKGEYGRIYEAKKRQIKCILNKQCEKKKDCSSSSSSSCSSSSSSSCSSSSSSSSCEKKKCKKPEIKITYPKNHAKVGCDFCLKFEVKNLGKQCLEWCWAGKKGGKVKKCNEVKIHLEKAKKGWNCVELKLIDKCGKVVACKKQKFYLCKDCCHSSSSSSCSSSSSSSCSSSSSSDCFVKDSYCCDSSSSSSSCSSSSSSSWCGKCKSSSSSCGCDSSSSSSSCPSSSSSSSSWCGKCKSSSSSCGCDSSSSSSSCPSSSSSSSSWCGKCKSSSSSCGCDSSSSSSSCSSSSSSSSSACVNPYDKKYSVSCGGYGWNKNHGSYSLKKRFEKCDSSSSSSSCSSSSSSSSCDKKRIYWKRK